MMNLFRNRWVRSLAWTVVTVITLYALLCAWVNWTGARMLRDAEARLKAEGETTDFRAVTSEPTPDAQNFCAIPLLKDISLQIDGDPEKGEPGVRRKRLERLKFSTGNEAKGRPPQRRGATYGERVSMEAWRDWLRKSGIAKVTSNSDNAGRDVLNALSAQDAVVAELAAGLNRPAARWTPPWKTRELPKMLFEVALPHYNAAQGMNQHLALRAIAAARAGDATRAHESLLIMAKLNEASMNDPFLIGLLVAATGSSAMVNATWDVCDAQCGSATDFSKLESALAATDYRRAALQAFRGEMAAQLNALRFMRDNHDPRFFEILSSDGGGFNSTPAAILSYLTPRGIFDANAADLIERQFDSIIKPMREQGWAAAIRSQSDFEIKHAKMREKFYMHPFRFFASIFSPTFASITSRIAHSQCLVDQATIACALERNRIEHGGYPDSLNGLKLANGKPLPMDALSGKPMVYRRTDNGKYALWCVGFDGEDDGGKRVLDSENPQGTKFSDKNYKGDWVWDFPAGK